MCDTCVWYVCVYVVSHHQLINCWRIIGWAGAVWCVQIVRHSYYKDAKKRKNTVGKAARICVWVSEAFCLALMGCRHWMRFLTIHNHYQSGVHANAAPFYAVGHLKVKNIQKGKKMEREKRKREREREKDKREKYDLRSEFHVELFIFLNFFSCKFVKLCSHHLSHAQHSKKNHQMD